MAVDLGRRREVSAPPLSAAGPLTRVDLDRALAGDPAATRLLVERLTDVVRARVARALRRSGRSAHRDVQQEISDCTQRVFEKLWSCDKRVLRNWDPSGLSLANYVGLVTEREITSMLRSRPQNPWTEAPTEPNELMDMNASTRGSDTQAETRQQLEWMLDELRLRLPADGLAVFEEMFANNREIAEICVELNLSREAIYEWRRRLRNLIRQLGDQWESRK